MSEQDETAPAQPDLAALLAEVDSAVAEKKARGLYDAAEIRRVEEAAVGLRHTLDDGASADMALRHAWLIENWDPKPPEISSHRRGLKGRLVVGCKRLLHRLTRPYIGIVLSRQTAINDQLIKLLNALVPQHNDQRQRQLQSERRLDAVEEQGRFLAEDFGQRLVRLEQFERGGEARLTALERQLLSGKAQAEALLAQLQRIVAEQATSGQASPERAEAVARTRAAARGAAYLAFEDLHRGPRAQIKSRQAVYLPHFRDALGPRTPLLDLGCGRGEFLELCREAGLPARGVDVNPAMVAFCRELGLDVTESDGLDYLRAQPDGAFGGVLLSQVIEHLDLDQLTELVALCVQKLAAGGVLIAETVNPQSLSTFAGAFYVDLTHNKPVHPEAARFLWRWAGLGEVRILPLSAVPPEHKLEPLPGGEGAPGTEGVFNRNVARLNELIYGPLDYAVVGRK